MRSLSTIAIQRDLKNSEDEGAKMDRPKIGRFSGSGFVPLRSGAACFIPPHSFLLPPTLHQVDMDKASQVLAQGVPPVSLIHTVPWQIMAEFLTLPSIIGHVDDARLNRRRRANSISPRPKPKPLLIFCC
jgi:hypothetical protein